MDASQESERKETSEIIAALEDLDGQPQEYLGPK